MVASRHRRQRRKAVRKPDSLPPPPIPPSPACAPVSRATLRSEFPPSGHPPSAPGESSAPRAEVLPPQGAAFLLLRRPQEMVAGRDVPQADRQVGSDQLSASILDTQPSIYRIQHTAFSLQPSVFSLQSSIFNLQSSTFNLQPSAFSIQPLNLKELLKTPAQCRSNPKKPLQAMP